MSGHNFLQQAGGRAARSRRKESTRPSLGGIEPTDYATRNLIANSLAAGAASGRRDVRGGAGSPERAAIERPRPIEQASRGIAARSRCECGESACAGSASQGASESTRAGSASQGASESIRAGSASQGASESTRAGSASQGASESTRAGSASQGASESIRAGSASQGASESTRASSASQGPGESCGCSGTCEGASSGQIARKRSGEEARQAASRKTG